MKKVVASALAAMTLGSVAYAETLTLYTDPATGQVFTKEAEGRIEMGDFVSAEKGYVPVKAKASKLQFSGVHYLGYKFVDYADSTVNDWSGFETRRNYFQVKSYLAEDSKSYLRVTMDTFQNTSELDGKDKDSWEVRLKYAYLYLDKILPFTGVEFGQVHRPWIDYEEHQGWWYRSISKVFVEAGESAHLTNSADLGVNFKTKTPYFTSEVGIFNGEGYHSKEGGTGNSVEWRFTGAFLGNGEQKRKPLKDTYFDASFFGQLNASSTKNGGEMYKIYGAHTVFNMPSLLVSAQYVMSDNNAATDTVAVDDFNGKGYSANGTYRFGEKKEFELIGRYDVWTAENSTDAVIVGDDLTRMYAIAGAAYQYDKNVKFILNGLYTDPDTDVSKDQYTTYMFTTEVHW